MPRFVKTAGRHFVNADDIMFVRYDDFSRRGRLPTVPPIATLVLRNGQELQVDYGFDLDDFEGTIVSAAPGAFAWTFYVQFGEDGEPKLYTSKTQVVAWRVHGDKAVDPIYLEPLTNDERAMFEAPDGRLNEPFNAVFENLKAAQAEVLRDAINLHAHKLRLAAAETSKDVE